MSDEMIERIVDLLVQRLGYPASTKTLSERERHKKLYQVLDYLDASPNKAKLTVRQLEAETGVSKSLVARARRIWLSSSEGR
jgi:hypothetical protein